jgi:hypothetical protein
MNLERARFEKGDRIIVFVDDSPEECFLLQGKIKNIESYGKTSFYHIDGNPEAIPEIYCFEYSNDLWNKLCNLFKKLKDEILEVDQTFGEIKRVVKST